MIRLTGFSVQGYKVFGQKTPMIDLAPITIILGRNNSGKSALCRAPLFFTHLFRSDAWTPFPLEMEGIDFGMNLSDICFNQRIDGFKTTLSFRDDTDDHIKEIKIGGATIQEKGYQQIITDLQINCNDQKFKFDTIMEWPEAQEKLSRFYQLQKIPNQIKWLKGIRDIPERKYRYAGNPDYVGNTGKYAPLLLAHSKLSTDNEIFITTKQWFEKYLSLNLDINTGEDSFSRENAFSVMIKHQSQSVYSNLADAGEGIVQVLPVVIVIKALQQKKSTPKLYIIEQPELHLHPYAHVAVAELMIETAERKSDCHLLIETHSEAFVLRVRRALAENRLTPDQVRIYFIEESTDKDEGSIIKPIVLNDRGTPDWWPDGIFTEAHREFQAIRKALSNR